MTDWGDMRPTGWPALRTDPQPSAGPFAAWYDAWRAQQTARRGTEQAERVGMRREIHLMSGMIAAWSLVMGGAAALAIWMVL